MAIPGDMPWDFPTDMARGMTPRGITPARMAQDIRNSPNYQRGQTVMLYVCRTGRRTSLTGQPYAQRLANFFGENVYAPTNILNRIPNGNADVMNGGICQVFHLDPITEVLGMPI